MFRAPVVRVVSTFGVAAVLSAAVLLAADVRITPVVAEDRLYANFAVSAAFTGIAILMALALSGIPIRFLSVLAVVVIVIWVAFAIYAGRRFDQLTEGEAGRLVA